ncbi:MAG TPA: NrfD/PsrC family molybdoenzyme membrane anchor subunit [Nitrospinota bacterium]|mgnify:FL=1|nr:NrfD/PsrC family molybdoenzyme membrane anchor subunit [Nitrospinota bacterium]
MSSNNVKRSSDAVTAGGHGDISLLPELEAFRDPKSKAARASYDDADIYRDEKSFNEHTLAPMFTTSRAYFVFVIALGIVIANGFAWFVAQTFLGMGQTNMHEPLFWGAYIATFVFWVGMSHSGTIVSSILRLSQANWRRPILRAAEAMTAFSLLVAGMFPLVHVGRLWRVYYMFPLPNQRELWPNFKSPLMWDMMAIGIYLTGSMTFLFIGLLPDLAVARDKAIRENNWRRHYLSFLSLGWRGSHREWSVYNKASMFLAVAILCIAPSVHTIVSWDFAMTMTPGWHTTIFGPYFVVGAIYSGIAAVITLMISLRWIFKLDDVIRTLHIDCLAKLLIVIAIIWTYFYFCEFNVVWYSQKPEEWGIWEWQAERFGSFLWIMVGGSVLSIFLMSWRKIRTNMVAMFFITLLVNVGMFIERYLIVVPILSHRDSAYMWTDYVPSVTELSIIVGSFAYFVLLYALFLKLFPIVTMADVKEGVIVSGDVKLGRHAVRMQVKE